MQIVGKSSQWQLRERLIFFKQQLKKTESWTRLQGNEEFLQHWRRAELVRQAQGMQLIKDAGGQRVCVKDAYPGYHFSLHEASVLLQSAS